MRDATLRTGARAALWRSPDEDTDVNRHLALPEAAVGVARKADRGPALELPPTTAPLAIGALSTHPTRRSSRVDDQG